MTARTTVHYHTPEEERLSREAALDETIADSFPASDPPSSNPNPADYSVLDRERSTVPERVIRKHQGRRGRSSATPPRWASRPVPLSIRCP